MLTIEQLRNYGANVDEALRRCMNNETFYLMLVNKSMQDQNFARLREAVEAGDLTGGFEAAHALKGVMANLALTPLCDPIGEITELLRARTQTDYSALLDQIDQKRGELLALL